eukprot:8432529-Lingulodinium_polyedra.AAC.1
MPSRGASSFHGVALGRPRTWRHLRGHLLPLPGRGAECPELAADPRRSGGARGRRPLVHLERRLEHGV